MYQPIGLGSRMFAISRGNRCSIHSRVISKTQKMVLDTALLSSQHCKIHIKGNRAIQAKEQCPPLHLSVVAIKKGPFESPSTTVFNFPLDMYVYIYIHLYIFIYISMDIYACIYTHVYVYE